MVDYIWIVQSNQTQRVNQESFRVLFLGVKGLGDTRMGCEAQESASNDAEVYAHQP